MASPDVELRGDCPRDVVDVIDALSGARRQSRMQLVNEILGEWARMRVHEANVVQRVTRSNPELSERAGSAAEKL